jgi:hypothetical protein
LASFDVVFPRASHLDQAVGLVAPAMDELASLVSFLSQLAHVFTHSVGLA